MREQKSSECDGFRSHKVRVLGACTESVAARARTEAVIAQLAGAQRGRVARWQLLAAGVSASAIDRRVRAGALRRVHQGVYGVPGSDQIPFASDAAAILACGPGAALSHHSAAVLWQLRAGVANPVHVTVPYGSGSEDRGDGLIVHRSRILTRADIRIHQRLPVTSPARTLLDIAAGLRDRDVERLLDEALFVRRLTTRAAIHALLRRAGRHPGVPRLTRVAESHTRSTKTDSDPEEALLQLIRAAGLPAPEQQVTLLHYRLDFYWPSDKLAVEVDSYGTHGSPARFESDRRRDARLWAETGIIVLRFTRHQIEARPYEVIALLARALGSAAA